MAHIGVFLADGFEEIEALTVVDVCRRASFTTHMVSVTGKKEVAGSHGIAVQADALIADVPFEQVDMIVLPGGLPGATTLEACAPLMEQVKTFLTSDKYVAAICAAPGVLGRAGLLAGRTAVSYPSVEADLKGATIPQTEVAVDGKLITSRGMGTALPFALRIVEAFAGADKAKQLAKDVIYEAYR